MTNGQADSVTSDPFRMQADVLVVGAGGAGLPAAISAVENGAEDVLVLEKRNSTGGNAARAWGLFATESPVQKQALVDARIGEFFKRIMDWSHWRIDPATCRALIAKSGDTIRWLEEKGLRFDLQRYYPNQAPPVWHVPDGHGAHLTDLLSEECRRRGVRLALQTDGREIRLDSNGNVSGVRAERDGQAVVIEAQTVIVATGGYGGNRELLREHCDYYDESIRCFGLPHTGDGLLMTTAAGAATEGLGLLHMEWPHVHHDVDSVLATVAREPYMVYVNQNGQRFVDEAKGLHAFECANAVLRQPGKIGFVLFDDQIRRTMEEQGVILGRGKHRAEFRRGMPGLGDKLKTATSSRNTVEIADSWAGIAQWIDADAQVLQETIDRYNLACQQRQDSLFFKEAVYLRPLIVPPFYAIRAEPIFLGTIGGIKVDERMRVLRRQGAAIPGLFAAGADTGGWQPDTYCDALTGAALGFSINSGRIAGENAARYVRGCTT